MYSSAGRYTCAKYEASLGREKQDADTFAGWGVDYLKYDNCFNEGQEGTSQITYNRYKAMSDALNATGRPILYSMCNWGVDYPWNWASTIANSWRITGDIYDSFDRPDARCPCTTWDCRLPGFHCSVMNILNKVAPIVDKGRPGGWNDLDALEVGNSGMSDDEYKLHFTLWCVSTPSYRVFCLRHLRESRALVKSPLIMGNDISLMDAKTLSILSNPAIIAINQDPIGMPAFKVWQKPNQIQNDTYSSALYTQGETYFWTGKLQGGDMVAAFVNAGSSPTAMSATMEDIFIDQVTTGSSKPVKMITQTWDVYDLWANRMSDTIAQSIINGNVTRNINGTTLNSGNAPINYNSTAVTYKEGLAVNNTALLGAKIGVLTSAGTLNAEVASHGVAVFRLRSQGTAKRKRDEL